MCFELLKWIITCQKRKHNEQILRRLTKETSDSYDERKTSSLLFLSASMDASFPNDT